MFYRAALQRLEDAELLLRQGRTTGAVYLAGYGVECILKALILEAVPEKKAEAVLRLFHGQRAHDFAWLRGLYEKEGRVAVAGEIVKQLARVETWTTSMRYSPATVKKPDAVTFLRIVAQVIAWAEQRL